MLIPLHYIHSLPPYSLDEIIINLAVYLWNVYLHFKVSHSHILDSSLEVNSIRVVEIYFFMGEENIRSSHQNIDSTLCWSMICKQVSSKKRKLAKEFYIRLGIVVDKSGLVIFNVFDIVICFGTEFLPNILEDMNFFSWKVEPLAICFINCCFE